MGQILVPLRGAGLPAISPPPAAVRLAAVPAEASVKGLRSAMPMQFLLSSADGQILPHIHNIYIKKAT